MNEGVSYTLFYDILLNLREYYHSYGRMDDSNAKLDEITKLIAISYSLAQRGEKFNIKMIRRIAKEQFGNEEDIAEALRYVFETESHNHLFVNDDGTNIFGANATLNIQPTEDSLAEKLIVEIEKIDFLNLLKEHRYQDFDLINECFGHFVRENFRNNKEDAQYMTPYEISNPMLEIIFNDMINDGYFTEKNLKSFCVMDPTCGVGTLLIESSNHFTRFVEKNFGPQSQKIIDNFRKSGILGQDKIDRIVRLSKINALLLGSNPSNIKTGNSIVGESEICKYYGKIDLIFTNPPFGAGYSTSELDMNYYPLLREMNTIPEEVDSELLMLDRCIGLLKDGGYLAIVLPDSVFASKGENAIYREALLNTVTIKGIVELPSVTFAQAGTRTNTCILYVKKNKPRNSDKFFVAVCKDLGYVVKERTGVPVKIAKGTNQMETISACIVSKNSNDLILSKDPSVTRISVDDLDNKILKPSFYSAERFLSIEAISENTSKDFTVVKLSEIVDFVTKSRKSSMVTDNKKHISVLHINADCTINFSEVEAFDPISPGRACETGDLIFSKINPRIPRMSVVPERPYSLICSNEFEIMRPKKDIGIYTLCFLLRTGNVQKQIENLTSGTSSSHSRIKREQLADILVPIPKTEKGKKLYEKINKAVEQSMKDIYLAEEVISKQLNELDNI